MRFATWGTPRVLTASALLLLASLTVVAGGSAARTPEVGAESLVQPLWTPLGLRDAKTTVVLQLVGDPVAVVEDKANRDLSTSEKNAIKAQLQAKQDGLRAAIQRLGGAVLGDYQVVYNGVKVRIDRSKAAGLAALPGVMAVRPLALVKPDNIRGVQLIGAPTVWDGDAGLHGENIKIAVIDTGVDYTHANFGGPGTTAAYNAANATDTLPPSAALGFGNRVKGGFDFVGDDYNADPDDPAFQPVPHPDPNPLDCNGHGSHVAGTAAGSGVTAVGATYPGPYSPTTITGNTWTIGPGVAPKADIYALRVFGCEGSSDVVVDAIEWAVDNDMDVINMSLGSDFGGKDEPSAVASTIAAKAGVIVVASAGNGGPSQYIAGSPANGAGALSVAAIDSSETFPGATITIPSGPMTAVNANEFPLPASKSYTVRVITDNPATTTDPDGAGTRSADESLGCDVASFGGPNSLPANTIAVVNRGTCARVAKAIFGQQAGAAAVVMVNNVTALPPVEGPITSNPDDGTPFTVTIPFLGVRGLPTTPTSDGGRLRAANGQTAVVTPASITNGNFRGFADFSSGGPRIGDSALKPDISAPGVSIVSTGSGTGNKAATISGTSMASPHVAGVAVLTRQAHLSWSVENIKAAIMNTGDPAGVTGTLGFRISRGGTGLVQPAKSTKTQVVALAKDDEFAVSTNYGFAELGSNFSQARTITLRNLGGSPATFSVAQANATTSPAHTVGLSATSVTVPAGGTAEVQMTLGLNPAAVGSNVLDLSGLAFREVAGMVQFTPTAGNNSDVTLRVPYYFVPRALSKVDTTLADTSLRGITPRRTVEATATVTNPGGVVPGGADFYAWGLSDPNEAGNSSADVRGIGVQSFLASDVFGTFAQPKERFLVFAVNTHDRWSNAATNEFDIAVDVNNDKKADYVVVSADQGAVETGNFNGRTGTFVFSTRSGGASRIFGFDDPTNSSTLLLPVLSRQFCRAGEPCLTPTKRIRYEAAAFDLLDGSVDQVDGSALYNAFVPVLGEGAFTVANPNTTRNLPLSISVDEWFAVRPLGLMVVTLDNASGAGEAKLLPVNLLS
jgi:minor extracellular serine protease Vpr